MQISITAHINVMQINTLRSITLVALTGLLAACATPRSPAPISDRTVAPASAGKPQTAAASPGRNQGREADRRGYYSVKRGDTLIHIALEFGQNYNDLIAWNNLANPNDIKVDQVLRVLPPDGSSTPGVQTSSVAANGGTEVRPLGAPAPAAAVRTAPAVNAPRGDKRPYSDSTLAELQKPDGSTAAVALNTPAPAPVAKIDTPAKTVEAPAADLEAISWMWPTEGKIVGTFDDAKKGIDIAGTSGQQVLAAAAGKILYANSIRGYGNLVIVKHSNNLLSAYAHNKTILVKENQTVTKGQKIAEMGNTDSDAVKLHFEIRQQGKPVDPTRFLPGR
jgi:lipoprotein NlpD